jgi:hypothetical protein
MAVGYETITTIHDNFNTTQAYWWCVPFHHVLHYPLPMVQSSLERNRTLLPLMHKQTCDPHQFGYGDAFFTNISIYEYRIAFIKGSSRFTYTAAALGGMCNLIYHGVKVDTTQWSVESIVCSSLPNYSCHWPWGIKSRLGLPVTGTTMWLRILYYHISHACFWIHVASWSHPPLQARFCLMGSRWTS